MSNELMVPESPERSKAIAEREAGAGAMMVRATEETRDQILAAKRWPRDENAVFVRAMRACRRLGFAERAQYVFPRGGKPVTGPSVYLARELARVWGNLRVGFEIVAMDEQWIHVRGFAVDLEANVTFEAHDKFRRLIQRRVGGSTKWIEPDERDATELVNRHGAKAMRNAILQVVPSDLVEDALAACHQTVESGGTENREERLKKLVLAFDSVGVSTAMLEAKLGHSLAQTVSAEFADLRGIYTSIREGNTQREDHFTVGGPTPAAVVKEAKAAGAVTTKDRVPGDGVVVGGAAAKEQSEVDKELAEIITPQASGRGRGRGGRQKTESRADALPASAPPAPVPPPTEREAGDEDDELLQDD